MADRKTDAVQVDTANVDAVQKETAAGMEVDQGAENHTSDKIQLDLDDEPYEISADDAAKVAKDSVVIETSAILDSVMSDKDKVISIAGIFLFIVGSYLNFWSLYRKDIGIMNQGNLFGGYLCGGLFGKACVILAIVSLVMIFLNQTMINWYISIGLGAFFVVQVALMLIFGRDDLGGSVCSVMPGVGFFICLICVGVILIFSKKLFQKGK